MGGIAAIGGSPADTVWSEPVSASAENNINSGSGTVYVVDIDATGNPGEDVFVGIYDHAAPTVGTTVPEVVLKALAGTSMSYSFPSGIGFATGISVAAVQEKCCEGTTSPSGAVTATIGLS